VRDQELERLTRIAATLVALVDHEAPQEALGLLGVVVEHHEAYGGVARVDGAEPGLLAEVGLGNRDGVGGDEPLLGRAHLELADGDHRVLGDLPQAHLGLG
jgi:hypothetical protein